MPYMIRNPPAVMLEPVNDGTALPGAGKSKSHQATIQKKPFNP